MNERALQAYKKAGFISEGRQREFYYSNGKWYDRISMSILEQEWRGSKESEEPN